MAKHDIRGGESITDEKIPVSVLVVPKIATPLQNRICTNVLTLPYLRESPDGTYCARFPWRIEHRPLPSNYAVCAKRTRLLARHLGQDPNLLKTNSNINAKHEEKAFIEKVSTTNLSDRLSSFRSTIAK
jgi:hypothetical protein